MLTTGTARHLTLAAITATLVLLLAPTRSPAPVGARLVDPALVEPAPAAAEKPPHTQPHTTLATRNTGPRIRVAIVSDLNSSYGSTNYRGAVHKAVDDIIRRRPDLVLSTGDMIAGQRRGLNYRAMWAGFDAAVYQPFALAEIPFAATPGNHDGSSHPYFAHERRHYRRYWQPRKPKLAWANDDQWPFNYSFTFGHAYIISLDTTGTGRLERAQMAWLSDELERASAWPIVIVFGHVPLYAFARNRESEAIADPDLERLYLENNVDIAISGHHHTWYPGRRGDLRLAGAPCLGNGARRLIGDDEISKRGYIWMEFDRDGIHVLDSYAGEDFRLIERNSLPPRTGTDRFPIDRDDLDSVLGPDSADEDSAQP